MKKLITQAWYRWSPATLVTKTESISVIRPDGTADLVTRRTVSRVHTPKRWPRCLRNAVDMYAEYGKRRPPVGIANWREDCQLNCLTSICQEFAWLAGPMAVDDVLYRGIDSGLWNFSMAYRAYARVDSRAAREFGAAYFRTVVWQAEMFE